MLATGKHTPSSSLPPSLRPFPPDRGLSVSYSFFTLPEDLSTTLRSTNGSSFEKFLSTSGSLGDLSNSSRITIFALTDAAVAAVGNRLTTTSLNQQIIRSFPGYTPDFVIGKPYSTAAGGSITITTQGGNYYANGVKIVKADAITKNGVVHYVDNVSFFLVSICLGLGGVNKLTFGRSSPSPPV